MKLKITSSAGQYWFKAGNTLYSFPDLASAMTAARNSFVDIHYLVMQGYTQSGIVLHA